MNTMIVGEAQQTSRVAVYPLDALEPVLNLAPQCVQIGTGSTRSQGPRSTI